MTKDDFLLWYEFQDIAQNLGEWTVCVGKDSRTPLTVGAYYTNGEWSVYRNTRHGSHRIRLQTKSETKAFAKLKQYVDYILKHKRIEP